MRHAIWKKDDFFQPLGLPRLDMKAEAIDFDPDGVPLTQSFEFSTPDAVLGAVINLKVEDGELTGEVMWHRVPAEGENPLEPERETNKPAPFRLGGYFNHIEKVDNQVAAATLRVVALMPIEDTPGWVKES